VGPPGYQVSIPQILRLPGQSQGAFRQDQLETYGALITDWRAQLDRKATPDTTRLTWWLWGVAKALGQNNLTKIPNLLRFLFCCL